MRIECAFCGNGFLVGRFTYCTHCGRPSLYPNIVAVEVVEEYRTLVARYDAAVAEATSRGASAAVHAFEDAASKSEAVIARYLGETMRLSLSDDELYATYFQMVEAGARPPASDRWNRIRARVEEALFPGYKDSITFAALSLERRGLPHYGDCFLVFREDMVAHRAAVLEENCILWMDQHNVAIVDDDLPLGYRSNWGERERVAVAKLALRLTAGSDTASYASLLMQHRAAPDDNDAFVEVHIWGPWTRRTLIHVVIYGEEASANPDVEVLRHRLDSIGVTIEVL